MATRARAGATARRPRLEAILFGAPKDEEVSRHWAKGEKGSVGRASRASRPPGIISDARERIGVDRAAHLRADIAIVRELVVERADGA